MCDANHKTIVIKMQKKKNGRNKFQSKHAPHDVCNARNMCWQNNVKKKYIMKMLKKRIYSYTYILCISNYSG